MGERLQRYVDLVLVLTHKEIKVKYKNSFFGYLWSIGHPLAFATVFFVAFKVVMRIQIQDYALFLITGLFPWQWFSNAVNLAPMVFIGNATIIKKVNFPRNLLPFTGVLHDMIHFILAIPVIILFLFIHHRSPALSWLYGVPILLVIQFLFTYGICLVISSTNLFFRDLERLTVICMTLLFYLTPVIYPETMIPARYHVLMNLNPLAPLIISWRKLLLDGDFDVLHAGLSLVYGLCLYQIGIYVYRKLAYRFAEVL